MDDLDNSGCDDLNKMELLSSVTIFVAFSFRFKTEDDNTGQAEWKHTVQTLLFDSI